MRSIAVMNQKGGVGKTTTSVNLGAALAQRGRRVLLVDIDPQSHATLHVGVEPGPEDATLYDVLVRGVPLAMAARTIDERLAIVPAHIDLVGAELELAALPERELVLTRAFAAYHEHFDFCVVDCAPSLGLLTVNALAAVHEVLIPLQPHFLALHGLGRLLETVAAVRQSLNPALHVGGVVLCQYEKGTRLAQEVREDVERFIRSAAPDDPWHAARLFSSVVRRNIKLAEAPSFGRTIFQYAPSSHGAEDYLAIADELLADEPRIVSSPQRGLADTGVRVETGHAVGPSGQRAAAAG